MNNSLTGTPAKAIRKPTCMLPMLNSAHASDRAFKMVCIVFCVGRLILLAPMHTNHMASWLEGKIRTNNYNIFLVLTTQSCRATFWLIVDCGRNREWGPKAAVGCRRPPWSVGAWLLVFTYHVTCVRRPKHLVNCSIRFFLCWLTQNPVHKKLRVLHFLPKETRSKKSD